MKTFDVIVIGAGPAGLSAASVFVDKGLNILLLDEQAAPGGQIYRNLERHSQQDNKHNAAYLGTEYFTGQSLLEVTAQNAATLDYRPNSTVWRVDSDASVCFSTQTATQQITTRVNARHIVVCTGATERPVPVPGWTLPGVMTVGAAQILLKSASLVPQNTVVAGSGPLLYLFVDQLLAAGAPPLALIETSLRGNTWQALKALPQAVRGGRVLADGVKMLARIRRSGVPRYRGAKNIVIDGDDAVSQINFRSRRQMHRIVCESVLLHQGVVPNIQLTRSVGLEHNWNERQRCFQPVVTQWGETALEYISVAGDGAGIAGASIAATRGRQVALNVMYRLGKLTQLERDSQAAALPSIQSELATRPFLDSLYCPPSAITNPSDNTVICRCEHVTAAKIRACAHSGCTGPNQTKAYSRCGMGPCQGRNCALTVTEILAAELQQHPSTVGSYRIRAPIKPVSLAELASLVDSGN